MLQTSTFRRASVVAALSAVTLGASVGASTSADPVPVGLDPGVYRSAIDAPAAVVVGVHHWVCYAANAAGGYGYGYSIYKDQAVYYATQNCRATSRHRYSPYVNCFTKWCK